MDVRKYISIVTGAVFLILSGLGLSSCKDDDADHPVTIFYAGVTNIGPGMTYEIPAPSYKGAKPGKFTITAVKFDETALESESFTIDEETGAVTIDKTASLETGQYYISVGCVAKGKRVVFRDIIEINMMPAMPSSITAEPTLVKIPYDGEFFDKDLSSQIVFTSESVTASKYEIVGDNAKYFTVSSDGKIQIKKASGAEFVTVPPGIYPLDIKVVTKAGNATFENVLSFDIYSKPLAGTLKYPGGNGIIEIGAEFASVAPEVQASADGLGYSIAGITPATDQIKIDPATGVIKADEGNTLQVGDVYKLNIKVTNAYGSQEYDNIYTCDVVAYINPVSNFSYTSPGDKYEGAGVEVSPNAGLLGDNVSFSFVDLPTALTDKIQLDAVTGKVSVAKKNTIPIGNYTIKVKAENLKNSVEATITLNIIANQNKFTYILYGNNLGLSPADKYPSQFRYWSKEEIAAATLTPTTDITSGATVKWTVQNMFNVKGVAVDASTGKLTFTAESWKLPDKNSGPVGSGLIFVTATVGENTDAEYSITEPVFFNYATYDTQTGYTVIYTPFVLTVDPSQGGKSTKAEIKKSNGDTPPQFALDYRRTFNYYNLNGPEWQQNGTPEVAGSYLASIWENYFDPKDTNNKSKDPVSYYSNLSNLAKPYMYVDNAGAAVSDKTFSVIVPSAKWDSDAKGIFVAQMTFVLDNAGNNINSGRQAFSLFIWFDEKFKTN